MDSTALNTISYTGQVNLAWYSNGKKMPFAQIHNIGGNTLFDFIVDCLLGDFTKASKEKPAKVALLNAAKDPSGEHITRSSLWVWVTETTIPTVIPHANGCTIRYSFIIPQEYITSNFNSIGLYPTHINDTALDKYCAICEVKGQTNFNFNAATALAVDWDLNFTNSTTTL